MPYARSLIGGAALATLLVASSVVADEAKVDLQAVGDALRADKKAIITANLALTDDEAKAFWPIYEEYDADIKGVQQRTAAVVADYAANRETLTDEQASNLTAAYLLAEEDRATFRRAYLHDFAKVLPGKKLARFYQIENKFDAQVRYELAQTIPLVKQ